MSSRYSEIRVRKMSDLESDTASERLPAGFRREGGEEGHFTGFLFGPFSDMDQSGRARPD